jgi:hypothetical protein
MSKVKVLFVAANPAGTQPLKLDEEIRQITAKVRAAEYRDSLELVSRWAVHPNGLLQALLEEKPHVVHFSGHGSHDSELILLDDGGNPKPVGQEVLVHLFRTLRDNVRVVLLNACYSRPQAEALAEVIDCTVGMNRAIGDQAAIVFAASFYRALGFGRSVREAFELGRAALLLEDVTEDKTPELLTRKGVDAAGLVLMPPAFVATPPAERLLTVDRAMLVRTVSGLSHNDLAQVVIMVEGAAPHVSRHGTVPEQTAYLFKWAESPAGPGLESIERAFNIISSNYDLNKLTPRERLITTVSNLSPADLATLTAAIPDAAPHVSRYGTVSEQAAELIHWAESVVGPGLEAVEEAFEFLSTVVNPEPTRNSGKIFVSYRRDDTGAVTGRIYDRLASKFGINNVFYDIDSIPFGVDFRSYIDDQVSQCVVFIAVIGERWLSARQNNRLLWWRRRIDDHNDFVRIEIKSALRRGIPVFPVLIGRATMPKSEQLPSDIKDLAFRQAARVEPEQRDFNHQVERLINFVNGKFF